MQIRDLDHPNDLKFAVKVFQAIVRDEDYISEETVKKIALENYWEEKDAENLIFLTDLVNRGMIIQMKNPISGRNVTNWNN